MPFSAVEHYYTHALAVLLVSTINVTRSWVRVAFHAPGAWRIVAACPGFFSTGFFCKLD